MCSKLLLQLVQGRSCSANTAQKNVTKETEESSDDYEAEKRQCCHHPAHSPTMTALFFYVLRSHINPTCYHVFTHIILSDDGRSLGVSVCSKDFVTSKGCSWIRSLNLVSFKRIRRKQWITKSGLKLLNTPQSACSECSRAKLLNLGKPLI